MYDRRFSIAGLIAVAIVWLVAANTPGAHDLLNLGCLSLEGVMIAWFIVSRGGDKAAREQRQFQAVVEKMEHATIDAGATVPRHLPAGLFAAPEYGICKKIEIAAEASVELSRRVGVIYMPIPAYFEIARGNGTAAAAHAMNAIADEFRRRLRPSDQVAIVDDNVIVICVCLLSSLDDLKNVAMRLNRVVRAVGAGDVPAAVARAGVAMYPIDGYTGREMVLAAKSRYLARIAGTALAAQGESQIARDEPVAIESAPAPRPRRAKRASAPKPRRTRSSRKAAPVVAQPV
jgi:hypothetical protein